MPGVRTLGDLIACEGPLAAKQLREVAAGVADALARVHAIGLVHGGLGPDHVLITANGPRVTGFAGRADTGGEAGDPSEDVYAFATLITLAGGGLASPELRPLLRRCLDPDPRQRPTAHDLDRVLSPRPLAPTPPAPRPPTEVDVPHTVEPSAPPAGHGATRRRLLIAAGVTLTGATVAAAGLAIAGLSTDPGVPEPSTRWRRGVEGRVTSLQVFDRVAYCACTADVVKAVGTDGGVGLWTARTESAVDNAPLVTGTAVFVACAAGQVYALDPGTGQQMWRHELRAGVGGSPLLFGTSLVVGTAGDRLIALDMAGGGPRWEWEGDTGHGGVAPIAAGPAGDRILLAHTDGTISAFHPDIRSVLWSTTVPAPVETAARAVDGLVYVVSDTWLSVLNARTGTLAWRFRTGPGPTTPTVANGIVYTSDADTVYALDARTGVEVWRRPVGARVPSPVAVVDGVVYGGGDETLHAFDPMSGKRHWTHPVPAYPSAAPAGARGVLLLGTGGSELIALNT